MAEETLDSVVLNLLIRATDEMSEPLRSAAENIEGTLASFRSVVGAVLEVGAAFETLKSVVEPAAALETALTDLAIATDASAAQLAEAKENAEALAATYGLSAEAVLGATKRLAQGGLGWEQAVTATGEAAKLALIAHVDVGEAARLLAIAYQDVGDKSKSFNDGLAGTTDLLTLFETKFNTAGQSLARLGMSFSQMSGLARQFHIPLPQLETLYAELGRLGVGGVRGPMMVLQQLTEEIFKDAATGNAWTKAGLHFAGAPGDINYLQTLLNAMQQQPEAFAKFVASAGQVGVALAQLQPQFDQLRPILGDIHERFGRTDAASGKLAGTFSVLTAGAHAAVTALAATVGDQMLPYLESGLKGLTAAATALSGFAAAHPLITQVAAGLMATFAAATAAAAGLHLLLLAGGLIAGVFTAPVLVGIAAIAALAIEVAAHWTEIVGWYKWGAEQVRYAMDLYERFVRDPLGTIEVIQKSALRSTKTWLDATVDSLQWAGTHPKKALAGLSEWLLEGFAAQLASVQGGLSGYKWEGPEQAKLNKAYFDALKGGPAAIGKLLGDTFSALFDGAALARAFRVPEIMAGIGPMLTTISGAWQKFHAELDVVYDAIGNKIDWLVTKFHELVAAITPSFHLPSWLGGSPAAPPVPALPAVPLGGPRVVPMLPPSYRPPWSDRDWPRLGTPSSMGPQEKIGSVTYSPVMHLAVNGTAADPASVQTAVENALSNSRDAFARQWQDWHRDNNRASFADPASSLA